MIALLLSLAALAAGLFAAVRETQDTGSSGVDNVAETQVAAALVCALVLLLAAAILAARALQRSRSPRLAADLAAFNLADRRTVNSGSWLTRRAQGNGIGAEIRAALLMFAFDTLGAEWAESSAAAWNTPSLTVSYKLGYEPNGVTRVSPRPGQPVDEQRVGLSRGAFKRPTWNLQTIGDESVLAQLGITA